MAEYPDLVIGGVPYKVLTWDDPNHTMLSFIRAPMEREWQSLLANQASPSGRPSIQNVRNDDLRWYLDSFAGGEGQIVFRADDQAGQRRYYRSQGIDLSVPSQLQLARQMLQQGLTGAAPTTVEGDTWTDVIGSSSVSGTDRGLSAVGDQIKRSVGIPAAGLTQVDYYGYLDTAPVTNGSAFSRISGAAVNSGLFKLLQNDGAAVRTTDTPVAGRVTLTFTLQLTNNTDTKAKVTCQIVVRRQSDGATVATMPAVLTQVASTVVVPIRFTSGAVQYTYTVQRLSSYKADVLLNSMSSSVADDKTARCQVWNETAGTSVALLDVDLGNNLTTSRKLTSISFNADGASTYSIRVKRQAGASRKLWVDRAVYTAVTIHTPYLAGLGQGNRIWLYDTATNNPPGALYWAANTQTWVAVAALGATNNLLPIARDGSDYAEYILLDSGVVWQVRTAGVAQYTTAYTAAVGIACSVQRLFVLTEDAANGTRLWQADVDLTAGLPYTPVAGDVKYTVGQGTGYTAPKARQTPDTAHVKRMAATQNGVTFFVNHGARTVLYGWDAGNSVGAPITDFPPGFTPRCMVHALGLSYVGGGFPAVDSDGVTRHRPAVFVVDHSSGSTPQMMDIALHRDVDSGSRVQDMQLYGSDLWVVTQTLGATGTMRVWRIPLTAPGGVFLYQEVTPDDSMQSANARSLAINWRNKVAVWGAGNPYVEQDNYLSDGSAYLESSWFDFALSEQKLLLQIALDGTFPAGTSAEVLYALDGSTTFTSAGHVSSNTPLLVSVLGASVTFRRMKVKVKLLTTDPALTPTIPAIEVRAALVEYQRQWTALLNCMDQPSTYFTGEQWAGSALAANLFSLAATGSLVEMIDYYSSKNPEDAQTLRVVVTNPLERFIAKGESVMQVTFIER